jgi:hypothetical protein
MTIEGGRFQAAPASLAGVAIFQVTAYNQFSHRIKRYPRSFAASQTE